MPLPPRRLPSPQIHPGRLPSPSPAKPTQPLRSVSQHSLAWPSRPLVYRPSQPGDSFPTPGPLAVTLLSPSLPPLVNSCLSQIVYLRTALSASRVAPHISADLDLRLPRLSRLTLAHTTLIRFSTALANDVVPVCSFDIATIYFVLHWNIFPFHSILFAICTLSSRLGVVSVSSGSCNKALFN